MAHSACTAASGPILLTQLPQRDALGTTAQSSEPPAELQRPADEPVAVMGDEPVPFSTAEYARAKPGLRRPRG